MTNQNPEQIARDDIDKQESLKCQRHWFLPKPTPVLWKENRAHPLKDLLGRWQRVFGKQAGALKFSEEQMNWLRMLKKHIVTSFHVEMDDLDYTPFDAQGGRGRMYQLFGGYSR